MGYKKMSAALTDRATPQAEVLVILAQNIGYRLYGLVAEFTGELLRWGL